ncbi:MAG TPA: hypothetical protein VKV02_00380, partial [Acidobacteriaceae bacterium]|nr:hypothetical protein [Acidobacteriaceae bacterium]
AEFAGGYLEAFAFGLLAGWGVYMVNREGNAVLGAELADEGFVGIGFFAAEAVVDVDRGEDDAEGLLFGIGFKEGKEERGGVGAAGEGAGETLAGMEEGAVEALQTHRVYPP